MKLFASETPRFAPGNGPFVAVSISNIIFLAWILDGHVAPKRLCVASLESGAPPAS